MSTVVRFARLVAALHLLALAVLTEPVLAGAAHEALIQSAQQETGKVKAVCVG